MIKNVYITYYVRRHISVQSALCNKMDKKNNYKCNKTILLLNFALKETMQFAKGSAEQHAQVTRIYFVLDL